MGPNQFELSTLERIFVPNFVVSSHLEQLGQNRDKVGLLTSGLYFGSCNPSIVIVLAEFLGQFSFTCRKNRQLYLQGVPKNVPCVNVNRSRYTYFTGKLNTFLES